MEKHKETWREIIGYEGHYQVSSLGRVKSIKFGKESIKSLQLKGSRYYYVILTINNIKKTRKVHQLVAESFLGHIPCGFNFVVNHINYDRLDNKVENLEIITARENTSQKHLKSASKFTGVTIKKKSNRWNSRITLNSKRIHLGYFDTEEEASSYYENALKCILENRPQDIICKRKKN